MGFLIIALSVFAAMYGYVGWRIIRPLGMTVSVEVLLWIVVILLMLLPFIAIFLRMGGIYGWWIDVLAWVGYIGLGFVTLAFFLLLLKDGSWLVYLGLDKLIGAVKGEEQIADPERRRMIFQGLNFGMIGLAGTLTGYGLFEALRLPRTETVDVPIAALPPELENLRIVQITDIHAGPTIKGSYVHEVVERDALHPHDFVVAFERAEVYRSQVRIVGVLQDGVDRAEREQVVPGHGVLGRER